MVIRTARGIVRSVKIFDANRKGEIILRTGVNPNVDIRLKISNDNDSAFLAMTTVVSAGIKFVSRMISQTSDTQAMQDRRVFYLLEVYIVSSLKA